MSWPVGSVVVCVDDRKYPRDIRIIGLPLVKGQHYTVREFIQVMEFAQGAEAGIKLSENVRVNGNNFDSEWGMSRFRLAESSHSESSSIRKSEHAQ